VKNVKELPKISEAELEVMKILWTNSPLTANEVIQILEEQTDWKPKTVRTLLNRLVQKEAIAIQQDPGKVYAYYPIVSQVDFLQVETKSFLQRLYGGALKPFLVNFLREEKLSSEEISELKRILDEQSNIESTNDNSKDKR
jgi:BlaI family penicillinase repressor